MKIELVNNWKKLYKSHTVKLSFILAVLSILQINIPVLAAFITPQMFAWLTFGLGTAIGILRYLPQESLKPDQDGDVKNATVSLSVNAVVDTPPAQTIPNDGSSNA